METGIRSTAQLRADGITRRELEAAVSAGTARRIVKGWYALPGADQRVLSGIASGGRVGCLTGCRVHGVWTPSHEETHVVHGRGRTPAARPGCVLHWEDAPQPRSSIWPIAACIRQVAHRHALEDALIVADSALNLGLVTLADIRSLELPGRHSGFIRYVSRAESGSETRVRLFFQQRGAAVRSQVYVDGVGRVDLLLGDRLIVECDSDAHHRTREQYLEDRRRDLAARDLGYEVIRLSYAQIWYTWAATRQSLLRQLRLRRHVGRSPLARTSARK